jgi:hypothetical protein
MFIGQTASVCLFNYLVWEKASSQKMLSNEEVLMVLRRKAILMPTKGRP